MIAYELRIKINLIFSLIQTQPQSLANTNTLLVLRYY